MAADLSTLVLEVDSSGVRTGRRDLDDFSAAGTRSESVATKVTSAWRAFAGVMAALGLGLAIRELVQVADTMSLVDARLKLATKSSVEFMKAQADIYKIAQQNNVGLKETTELYVKLSKPIRDLGGGTKEVAGVTDAFAKALRVGGASATEASAATLQFAQAMASGKLQGDEFRSLAEASPRFMQALADGLGVPTGKLKEMGTEGKLTADVVGNALLKSLGQLSKEAAEMPDTVGGAFTRLANHAKKAIDEMNKSTGMTLGIAQGIESLRSLIPTIKTEIQGVVQTIGDFMERNKTQLGEAWQAAVGLGGSLWEVAKAAGTIVGFVVEWLVQSQTLKTAIEAIRILIAGLIDGVDFLGGLFATIGSLIFKSVLKPMEGWLRIAGSIADVFDDQMGARLKGYADSLSEFASAGTRYGDEVAARFMNGKTALAQLNDDLDKAKIKTNATAVAVAGLGKGFKELKDGAGGDDGKAAAKAMDSYKKLMETIKEKIALQKAEMEKGRELTEFEKLRIHLNDLFAGSLKSVSAAMKASAFSAVDELEALDKGNAARKEAEKLLNQTIAAMQKESGSYERQIELLKEQEEQYGKTAVEIAFMQATKLNAMAADKEAQALLEKDITLQAEYQKQAKQLREIASRGINVAAQKETGDALKKQIDDATKGLEAFDSFMNQLDLSKFDGLFHGSLKNIDKLITSTKLLSTIQEKSEKARLAAATKYGEDSTEYQQEIGRINQQTTVQTLEGYGQIIGAAKGFFDEQSRGYKVLEVAQAALGVATAAAAIANQGLGDPYTAIPRIIAMAATMAQLGFAVGNLSGGGAPHSNQGTGTVFGDSSAKSKSIENSIELLADSAVLGLRYSAAMAASLRNIEAAMVGVTSLLLRGNGMGDLAASIPTGYMASGTSKAVDDFHDFMSTATLGSVLGKAFKGVMDNIFGGLLNRAFGKKVSIQGSGISAGPQSFGDIDSLGFQGNYYADLQSKSKFFGITTSTKNSTVVGPLDAQMERQFSLIFQGIGDSVTAAAGALGLDMETVKDRLSKYIVDIGKIDLKDLTGEELQAKLSNVFSAEADKIAEAIIPGFEKIVKVGEGPFETLVRVAHQMEVVDLSLSRMGITMQKVSATGDGMFDKMLETLLGAPGVRNAVNADAVVQQFGGLDEFSTATQDYYRAFTDKDKQNKDTLDLIGKSLSGFGFTLPTTIAEFDKLTKSLDLTTDKGRAAFEVLVKLGPTFADITNSMADSAAEAAKAAADAVAQARENLLARAGLGGDQLANLLRDGIVGRLSQQDVGAKIGTLLTDGIYNALTGSTADAIATSFNNTILVPMLQNIAATGTIGAALSQSSLDDFVAEAQTKIKAMSAVLSSPEVQTALTQIQQGIAGITGSMRGLTSSLSSLNQTMNQVRYTANAADIAYANDPSLRAYEAAIQAGYKAQEAWQGVSKTIEEEVARLRGGGLIGESFATIQSQFAIATAQARAGDVSALAKLPELSKLLEEATLNASASLDEFRRAQALQANSLEQTIYGGNVPYQSTPEAKLYANPSAAYSALNAGGDVRTEIAGMRAEIKAQQEALVMLTVKMARIMERWEVVGVPVVNQDGTALATT